MVQYVSVHTVVQVLNQYTLWCRYSISTHCGVVCISTHCGAGIQSVHTVTQVVSNMFCQVKQVYVSFPCLVSSTISVLSVTEMLVFQDSKVVCYRMLLRKKH